MTRSTQAVIPATESMIPATEAVTPLGRIVLVTASPRTTPGVLSWPAWQALRAGPVLLPAGPDGDEPAQAAALREAGVLVEVVAPAELGALLTARAGSGQTATALVLPDAVAGLGLEPAEVVAGAPDRPGARLLDVVDVMDRLRSPGGCPWDAAQTHLSLAPYLLEEAYEAYEALEDADPVALREELGDVLLQVAFHARVATEAAEPWSIDDVADELVQKLVRRHPHVFAGADAGDLDSSWDLMKAAEKSRTSVTEGVPLGQPALALAAKLQRRGRRTGAPVPAYDGLGGELWQLVRRCAEHRVDPEAALRGVAREYRDALAGVERSARAEGVDPKALTPDGWRARWP